MTDLILPPQILVRNITWKYLDAAGFAKNPYTGAVITADRGGDRIGCTLNYTYAKGGNRAAQNAHIGGLRGRLNRVFIADPSYRRRGSFPTSELLANNTFVNGTTGYTPSLLTLTANDRTLRATHTRGFDGSNAPQFTQNATVVQYAPYVARMFWLQGNEPASSHGPALNAGFQTQDYGVQGMRTASQVAASTSMTVALVTLSQAHMAGQFFDVPYLSLSRCALADAAPNLLLQSNSFATTWTKSGLTLPTSNDTDTAPDGTVTAETLGENTANSNHYIFQNATVSSAAADYTLSCSLRASSRQWAYLQLQENTSSGSIFAYINLSTGALGTTATGSNWSNLRTFIVNQGNNWYRLYIVGRKTNAATSLSAIVGVASADNTSSYLGTSSGIAAWGASLSASSVPTRLGVTTTAALSSGTAQRGSGIYVKGLPASSTGLLLQDDWVEIIAGGRSILRQVATSLDSDAAGLGYLALCGPVSFNISDSEPVIVNEPMGRFIYAGENPEWTVEAGGTTGATMEFEEAAN